VISASMVLVWHAGQGGRRLIMMLALDQAGALQNSQSPVGADMRDGDGTSMLFRFAEWMVNIAHIGKVK
jgi:hypothetical protein